MFNCANVGISNYSFLTIANANLINNFGSKSQKNLYLPPLIEGRWFGTMCLSEPQAGSSLSDIRTKAEPKGDGSYKVAGTKMWISGGEHEITENIIHLVLAKIPGGPEGVKGISLFIVPKIRVNEDGSLGQNNNIALAGLNHKMGHRGTTNTLLNFGEQGECLGYLVGEEHQGLKYMFLMMNEARLGVGYGSVMSGLAGYLYSLDYARNRPQGRHPHNKNPSSSQVMIIEHADVKRMLMFQKASVEGAQALIFYCSNLIDLQSVSPEKERSKIDLLLDILTPIAKSWPSEFCLEANKLAIQILGGYGYTRDYPVERFYRDNRLNHIHEGTHAIHGLDLLGRKVGLHEGAAFKILKGEITETITVALSCPENKEDAKSLGSALDVLSQTTKVVLGCPDINLALANATLYLDSFGHIIIAWMWLKQSVAAEKALKMSTDNDIPFYQGKKAACRYFFRYELPKTTAQLKLVESLDDTCCIVEDDQFVGE